MFAIQYGAMCKETLRSDCSTTPKNKCIYTSTGAYTHLGSIENSRKVINLQRLQPIRAQTLLGTGIFNVSTCFNDRQSYASQTGRVRDGKSWVSDQARARHRLARAIRRC